MGGACRQEERDALFAFLRDYCAETRPAPVADTPCAVRFFVAPPSVGGGVERAVCAQWGATAAPDALPVSEGAWERWARMAVTEWCAVSLRGVNVQVDGDPVAPAFLAHDHHYLATIEDARVYLKPNGAPLAYYADEDGVETVELLPAAVGGTVLIEAPQGVTPLLRAQVRHQLTSRRPAVLDSGYTSHHSGGRYGRLLVEEVQHGVHTSMVQHFAAMLRVGLSALKIGVPSVRDVRGKLDMEAKLRRDEGVTGSLRPLVFTLEALEGTAWADELDNYPGLWLLSSEAAGEPDVRPWFRTLLLWDSALYVLAAACRFHGEFKPGLLFGREASRTVYLPERRYSKRDAGAVESAYLQINPKRVAGTADAVAVRLLQNVTHELAHLATYSNVGHAESFVARREHFFNLAADQIGVLVDLAELAQADDQRYKPTVERPLSVEQFLAEELGHPAGVAVEHLVARWATLRNTSHTRAEVEVGAELERQHQLGRVWVSPDEALAVLT